MGHRKLRCVPEAALELAQQHRHQDTFNRTGLLLLGGSQTTCSTRDDQDKPVASSNRFHSAQNSAMAAVPAIYEKSLSRILGRYLWRNPKFIGGTWRGGLHYTVADCIKVSCCRFLPRCPLAGSIHVRPTTVSVQGCHRPKHREACLDRSVDPAQRGIVFRSRLAKAIHDCLVDQACLGQRGSSRLQLPQSGECCSPSHSGRTRCTPHIVGRASSSVVGAFGSVVGEQLVPI